MLAGAQHLGHPVGAIPADDKLHLRKASAEGADHLFQEVASAAEGGCGPGPEQRPERVFAAAVDAAAQVQRQIAVGGVVAVEEHALLVAVGRIDEGIKVENNLARSRAAPGEKDVEQHLAETREIGRGDAILEAGEGRLAGEGWVTRVLTEGELQGGIWAHGLGVVGIFIAGGDEQDALLE